MAVGIAIVLVAGGGKLAMPAAAGEPAPAADQHPAVLEPVDVGLGALPPSPAPTPTAPAFAAFTPVPPAIATAASRSVDRRPAAKATPRPTPKPAATRRSSARTSTSSATPVSSGDPRSIARSILAARGMSGQFSCLDSLWNRESGWSVTASNPSGAYGIPQALPGSKMASAGSDWRTNAATQITWGLNYIASTYGSPCAAYSHSQAHGSY